jgi:hypothetical protein
VALAQGSIELSSEDEEVHAAKDEVFGSIA